MTFQEVYQKKLSEKNSIFMKRRELEQKLRRAGCFMKREGGSHSIWMNPATGKMETVPRHQEIKEPLAQKIIKNLIEND